MIPPSQVDPIMLCHVASELVLDCKMERVNNSGWVDTSVGVVMVRKLQQAKGATSAWEVRAVCAAAILGAKGSFESVFELAVRLETERDAPSSLRGPFAGKCSISQAGDGTRCKFAIQWCGNVQWPSERAECV